MPRPTIEGTVVRQIDMHHSSAGSNKDYRITISQVGTGQYRVYTEHGPAGRLNNGKELTKSPVGIGQATRLADEALDEGDALDALERVGLAGREELACRYLSQGQKRRVALARLVNERRALWVLDEPFVAMDDSGISMLSDLIAGHLAQGGIMGTHAFSQGSGTAHVLQVVHQALEGIQFLAHGLHLVPDFGLGRLHLAQQGIVFLHALLKVLVGCRNNSHVYLHRRIAANAIELAIGQNAQQARLHIERHIADLIEEQSPAVSLLKTSLTHGIGAGKCPFFVTEKFRFDQVFWDCSHIQCDKRRFCPRAMAMQGVRDQLFTGTGFAVDQYADR